MDSYISSENRVFSNKLMMRHYIYIYMANQSKLSEGNLKDKSSVTEIRIVQQIQNEFYQNMQQRERSDVSCDL